MKEEAGLRGRWRRKRRKRKKRKQERERGTKGGRDGEVVVWAEWMMEGGA